MKDSIFKRKIYSKLLQWKEESAGSTALLVEGARRIGKSTIVEEFARNEYEAYVVIDFSNVELEILELFNHVSNLQSFFLRLQALTGVTLPNGKSLVIFDEVQFCPKARQAIKHLVKDGRYHYIETGSLISIRQNIKDILIPSEERKIEMYPMDFEEFLWAIGKPATFDLIRQCYNDLEPLGDAIHRSVMRDFRTYLCIGGMPQAVSAYVNGSDFKTIDGVKRDILHLYMQDLRRIDGKGRASTIFQSIPAELSRNTLRYRVGEVIENARLSRLGELFADIADSKTVNFAYHADDPGIGLALHADYDYFKMYLADTGLFVTLAFMERDFTENDLYRKLLSDKLPADLGYVYENVVAQMLKSAGHSLFYYTFNKVNEEGEASTTYEIDFLINEKSKISPIEVKSSGYKTHKSLDEFQKKFSSRIQRRYLIYTKDLRREGDLLCLPVYMTSLI